MRKGSCLPINVNGGGGCKGAPCQHRQKWSRSQGVQGPGHRVPPVCSSTLCCKDAAAKSGRSCGSLKGSSCSSCILSLTSVISKLLQGGGCAAQGLVSRAVSENIKNACAWWLEERMIGKPEEETVNRSHSVYVLLCYVPKEGTGSVEEEIPRAFTCRVLSAWSQCILSTLEHAQSSETHRSISSTQRESSELKGGAPHTYLQLSATASAL